MCFGAQKNRIIEMVVLSMHSIFFGLRNRKSNFLLRTLICKTGELPPLTRIRHVLFISLGSLGEIQRGAAKTHQNSI